MSGGEEVRRQGEGGNEVKRESVEKRSMRSRD